ISFSGNDGAADVAIVMAGDAGVAIGEVSATYVELVIDRADLAVKLERKLDVTRFGSPVKSVASFHDRRVPDRVRFIAELAQPVTPTIDRDGGMLHWRFAADPSKGKLAHTQAVPTPIVGGFGAASTPVAQQSVAQIPPQGQ